MAERRTTGTAVEGGTRAMPPASTMESGRADVTGPPPDTLRVGAVIDRYIVVERLGAGAMGVVYAAYDPKLDRKVALKLLRRRADGGDQLLGQERLVREAKAIARLSHANIVSVFDVGVHQREVFLAMEYLSGGTLRRWVAAERRHWREVTKTFIAVGRGLEAAHAAGLIHRDFKADNVLLDRSGVPKIVDFGLVRLAEAGESELTIDGGDAEPPPSSSSEVGFEPLTRTGAVLGTPGYMAPEQFLGRPTDGRTDQFAFCASLYQALYGQRPFAGNTVTDIADAVTNGRVRPAPADSAVPRWLRKVILRGLATDPAQRHADMSTLLHALAADPVARWQRRVAVTFAVAAVAAIVAGAQRRTEHSRAEFERAIAARVTEADAAFARAQALRQRATPLRQRAFALFDAQDRDEGERVWSEARAVHAAAEASLAETQRVLEAALAMDRGRAETRRRLAETLFDRATLAELDLRREDVTRHVAALEDADATGEYRRRWREPGSLSVRTSPAGASLGIERYDLKAAKITSTPVGGIVASPLESHALPPGSYRLHVAKSGHAKTIYPFVIKRGESSAVELALPPLTEIPEGFAYVPAGTFLYGDTDEDLRLSFLNAVPLHERKLHAFLIATHETTFAEWMAFLSSLPEAERRKRSPGSSAPHGTVALTRGDGWRLRLAISGQRLEAAAGDKLVYPARPAASAAQDWLKMPVIGVAAEDMRAYLAWLSATGKVPGARFCTEVEWERAAKGADERAYPSALSLPAPGDANVDVTYGRKPGGYGPDEVGRHPMGRSPFDVDDMAGNVWEVATNEVAGDGVVVRGGSYFQKFQDARLTNREPFDPRMRHHLIGLRVCADWPAKATGGDRR
jgi:formylglycine-generating enzyme required for sulfatase activity